jgi:hypothetical protein
MALPTGSTQDEPDRQADKQANVMKDQLRKEVAEWNAARNETSTRQEADFNVPVKPRPAPRPAKQESRSQPAAAPASKPAGAAKKPFSMSFGGVTDAEHITYIIARGAR